MRQLIRSFWFLVVSITLAVILSFPQIAAAQSRSLYVPVLQDGASETVIALNNSGSAAANVTLIARGYDDTSYRGSKLNSVKVVLPPQNSKTIHTKDVFGEAISKGWVEVQTSSPAITGSFFLSDPNAGTMEASELIASPENSLLFPKVTTEESAENTLVLVNTGGNRLNRVSITLFDNSGRMVAQRNLALAAYSGWSGLVKDLMPEAGNIDGYAVINSGSGANTESLIGFETYRSSTDLAAIVAMPETVRFETGHVTQFASQAGYTSTLVLVNYGGGPQTVGVTAGSLEYNGRPAFTSSETEVLTLAPFERREVSLAELFDFSGDDVITGFVRYQVQDDTAGLYGYLELKSALGGVTVEPAQAIGFETSFISQIEDRPGSYSMLALMNPGSLPASIRVDAFDLQGYAIGTTTVSLAPNGYWSRLLAEIFPQTRNQMGGSMRITASSVVLAAQLMGSTIAGGPLAMLPAQGSTLEPYSISAVSARSGATVTSIDHGATLAVPPGALSQDLPIQITPLHVEDFPNPSATERLVGIVQGKPAGTQFRNPARLTFPLAEPLNPGTTLAVSIFNPQTHQYEPSGFVAMVEASGRSAWADVTHFTVFAVSTTQSVQISSLSPASGYVGAPITINGSGFGLSVDQNTVIFTARGGGVVTAPVVSASANVVTTVVPAGASNGRVYVQVGTVKSNGVRFKVNTLSNQAPSVNAGPDQNLTLSAGTAIATLAGTATDDGIPTGSTLTHTWQLFSGPASVLFADATSLNTSATFSVAGTYTLRLTSSDTMLTSSDDVVINVNVPAPINRAPTVSAGSDQTVLYPSGVNLAGTATDDGLPSGALTAAWNKVAGPGTVTFGNAAAFTTAATFSSAGTYTLRLTAGDGALTSTDDVVINVTAPANRAPVVNAGSDQTVPYPSGANLAGTATDDGLPSGALTAAWSKAAGPGTVTFGNAAAFTTAATFSSAGTYTLRLTANDGALTSTDDVVINVTAPAAPAAPANIAPVVTAGPAQTITYPNAASLQGSASDDGLPAASVLSVSWSTVSGPGSVIFVNANSLNATASFSVAGTYTLRLTATDGLLSSTSNVIITVIAATAPVAPPQTSTNTPPAISGIQIFPANNVWNTPVDSLPVQRAIDAINDHGGHNVHPDFGWMYNGVFNGIPVNVVAGNSTPKVKVNVIAYASESDMLPGGDQHSGFLPIPANAVIEGDPVTSPTWSTGADHHLLIIDSDTNMLHELYSVIRQPDGSMTSGSYSHWDLNSNALRPEFWTSTDAAGLPVTPGLIRYDQVQACLAVDPQGTSCTLGHAVRFTLDLTHGPHIWPARHDANSGGEANPPFGLRVRLKSTVSPSGYSPVNRIILNTLKKYGAILTDNGGDWFFQGSPDSRWNDNDLHFLSQLVPADSFEVVDTSKWIVDPDSGQADPNGTGLPVIQWPKPGAILALDFDDPTTLDTAPGFRSFPLQLYNSTLGYGWQSVNTLQYRTRSVTSDPLYRDLHMTETTADETFLVNVPNGTYSVTVFLGDPEWLTNVGLSVFAEGNLAVSITNTAAGQKAYKTFPVTVGDGQLTLLFHSVSPGQLAVAGIEIDPANSDVATPIPTLTLTASQTSITSGQSLTLSWTSSNATSCSASGAWSGAKATSGSEVQFNLISSGTYFLTCSGAGGSINQSVSVTVSASVTPPATVTITASPTSVSPGQSSTISWTSSSATSCSASGAWTGSKAISGSEIQSNLTSSGTYALTCSGAGGAATRSVNVLVSTSSITAGSLTLTNAGTGLDQIVTIDSPGQFRLAFEAADNWGLSQWYDLLHDPSAQNNLIGPATGSNNTDVTTAEPGLFQEVFYGTVPDDPKLYTRAAKYYFPTSNRSFQIIENTPSRITVLASSHPIVTAVGVLTNITGAVKYTIYPNGKIYVHSETTAQNPQTMSSWFNAIIGLENPGGTGTVPPDTQGWVRAAASQNPYSWTGITEKYLFAYWSPQTPAPYTNWSKASILLVPAANNPLQGGQIIHSWSNFIRWGYGVKNVNMTAGQTIAQDYLIQLGTQGSSLLPDITTSSVADPIANGYLSSPLP